MRFLLVWLGLVPAAFATSFTIYGTVLDPSGAPIPGAQVSAVNRVGVAAQTVTEPSGGFALKLAETAGAALTITAPGFETKTMPLAEPPSPRRSPYI